MSPRGEVLARIGGSEAGFRDLGHVAVDGSGATYVSEAGLNRLQKFSAEGARVAVWQLPKGAGEGEWYLPKSIALSGGNIVIEDWGNHRIVVQSSDGTRRLSFGDAKQLESTAGLCVDRDGNIYVADEKAHAVKKFDPQGKLLSVISNSTGNRLFNEGPSSIAVDANGDLYAADGLSVVKFSATGMLLQRWH